MSGRDRDRNRGPFRPPRLDTMAPSVRIALLITRPFGTTQEVDGTVQAIRAAVEGIDGASVVFSRTSLFKLKIVELQRNGTFSEKARGRRQ
jgi:hypothetical protein